MAESGAEVAAGCGEGESESGELKLPPWLNLELLQAAVGGKGRGEGESGSRLRVKGFQAQLAVGKGDNYASLMMRVRLQCVLEDDDGKAGRALSAVERWVVVKGPSDQELTRKWVERGGLFAKELRAYEGPLARMDRLLRDRLRGRPFQQLTARMLPSATAGVLVFEDLREQGFGMAERQSGLDLPHCLLALRGLATLHALSLAARREDPACVDFPESFFSENSRLEVEKYTPLVYHTLASKVKSWPGYERFVEKLHRFGDGLFNKVLALMENTEDKFKVLNHGDFWVNNIMFKYSDETGRPIDVRIVDFQIVRFGSLALDINYFLFSSPQKEIRIEKMDEMLSTYHTTYVEVLEGLGLEDRAMTWEELQGEMQRVLPFGVTAACNLLPIIVADPNDALNTDNVKEEDILSGEVDIFSNVMSGTTFAKALQPLLPYFEERGVL